MGKNDKEKTVLHALEKEIGAIPLEGSPHDGEEGSDILPDDVEI